MYLNNQAAAPPAPRKNYNPPPLASSSSQPIQQNPLYPNQNPSYVNMQQGMYKNDAPVSYPAPQDYSGAVPRTTPTPYYPSYPSNTPYRQDTYSTGQLNTPECGNFYPRVPSVFPYDSMYPPAPGASELSLNSSKPLVGHNLSGSLDMIELRAGPEFIQPTLQKVPQSTSLKQKSHLPIGLLIRPLAPTDKVIPDVNFGINGKVIRCVRCRTYINSFSTRDPTGRRWTCNICGLSNDCVPQYGSPMDEMGRRVDEAQHPEWSCGSVEIVATGDYMVRPPQPPSYLFLLDVSISAVTSGLVMSVCEGIRCYLDSGIIQGGSRTQIGFMSFDSSVHFYKIDPRSPQVDLIVVPTLADMFVPLPEGIMVNLKECETQIRSLLDTLPRMWESTKNTESCLGTALSAAHAALKPWGGKLSVFISTLPVLGDRHLARYREMAQRNVNAKQPSNANDVALLKPLNDDYMELSKQMALAQISVDLYACPPSTSSSYVSTLGLPTLGSLSRLTAGELRYYPGFTALCYGDKLQRELLHVLTRTTGWEAVMRIRVSQGWKISNWTGNFYFRNNDLLVLPNCHEDQVFGITLDHHETMSQDSYLYVQSALLYTNGDGERRIRVHSYCLPITQSLSELVGSMDQDTVMAFFTHQAIQQAMKTNLADARTTLQTSFFQLYSVLQQSITGGNASSKHQHSLLPYYVLGLLKSAAMRDSRDVTPDLRLYHWSRLLSLPKEDIIAFLSPRLYALHTLDANGYANTDEKEMIQLPPTLALSASHMSQDGAYLICDGESMMIWLGKVLDPQWLSDVFSVNTPEQIHQDNGETLIGVSGTPRTQRVAAIINSLRRSYLPFMKLYIVTQGSPNEYRFFYALIEDKNHACMMSYDDFCSKLSIRHQPSPKAPSSTTLGYHGYPQIQMSQLHQHPQTAPPLDHSSTIRAQGSMVAQPPPQPTNAPLVSPYSSSYTTTTKSAASLTSGLQPKPPRYNSDPSVGGPPQPNANYMSQPPQRPPTMHTNPQPVGAYPPDSSLLPPPPNIATEYYGAPPNYSG